MASIYRIREGFTFDYQGVEYETMEDAEDAVEEEVGQYMNNGDPRGSEDFVSECEFGITVYYNNEYWGNWYDYWKVYS